LKTLFAAIIVGAKRLLKDSSAIHPSINSSRESSPSLFLSLNKI
jgi:hypothetical protein